METSNYHTEGDQAFYHGGTESQAEASIEASIDEQLRRVIFKIKCDWDHKHHSKTSNIYNIVRPLHTLAYEFLEVLDTQPFNVTIRERLATVDFTLANIYRPGTTTPVGYPDLHFYPKLLFQQLRRVLVESSYFDWCIETRDWREFLFASDNVREAILEKRRLVEEHIILLNNRIQNGIESSNGDERIAQIQEYIFAGDFFTKKDRDEHRIQMDMIETRQNVDQQIRKYVKGLMSAEKFEEAQWVHEIFEADETQRVILENVAKKQKQKRGNIEVQRQQLLKEWAFLECERRRRGVRERAKRTKTCGSSTHVISQATPNQANVDAAQNMPITPINSGLSWTDEMNDLADIEYHYATDNNFARYFDPATGRIFIPAGYRPPGRVSHHTWMDSKDPDVFNKNLFFVENGAYLEAAAKPAMPFYMVAQIYDKMCCDGSLGINTFDLIEKRIGRENAVRLRTDKKKMVDEGQREALALPIEPALMHKKWDQNLPETSQHGIQNAAQQNGGNTSSRPCQITGESFMYFIQNHITAASINKYYEVFLSKKNLIASANGVAIVSVKHYEMNFRRQLTRMIDQIINQAQQMGSEYERQLFYHSHLAMASIRRLYKDAAQALNQLEKTMFQTYQIRTGVQSPQAFMDAPHSLYPKQQPSYSGGSTELHVIGSRSSSITSLTFRDKMKAIYNNNSLPPDEKLFQGPTLQGIRPNHETKLRLLQALADQATRRATLHSPAKSRPSLAAAPALMTKCGQKRDVPDPEHEEIYIGTVFGWASVHDPRDRFPGMTEQEYMRHLKWHQMQGQDNADQQRNSSYSSTNPEVVVQVCGSGMAAERQAQNVIDNVLSGEKAQGQKIVSNRIRTHQPGQQEISPHARAGIPVGINHQKHQACRKIKLRGPSTASHLAPPPGVQSSKPRTPSMLGQYAITVELSPDKDMLDKVAIKMPRIVFDDSTQVIDTTAPIPLSLVCSPTRDDNIVDSKPKTETSPVNEIGEEPEEGVRLPHIAGDIIYGAESTASESSSLMCSPARDDSVMELKGECIALIQEARNKLLWDEMPMPKIISRFSKNDAQVIDMTARTPSRTARFSLSFHDDATGGLAKLHYSNTREDAVSFAVTDALHRGLNPTTALSKATAIGFSNDSLTDEEVIDAVKPLMPFLCSSDRRTATVKKAIAAAVDAAEQKIYPLAYLYEFIRFTTVAPPEKVSGNMDSSKRKIETLFKAPVKTLIKTPAVALCISTVAAGNVAMATKSPLSPMAPIFIPSRKVNSPVMSGNRVAYTSVTESPVARSSFQSGSFSNQPSSALRIQEHIDSIVCAAGSPLALSERILVSAANKMPNLSLGGLRLCGPSSFSSQHVRFPVNTTLNTSLQRPRSEAVVENEKNLYQTHTNCPGLALPSVSITSSGLRDPVMPQISSAPKSKDLPIRPKIALGPFAKKDTLYYKTPPMGGPVKSRVASFDGANTSLPLVSDGSPGKAGASKEPQVIDMTHNDGVADTIVASVKNIQNAMQQNPLNFTQLIPSQNFNSTGPMASAKVLSGQAPICSAAARKIPPKQTALYSSSWAPPASAPKGPRSNVARRNRPLRGPHADASTMFENQQSQQQTSGSMGLSEPPMVKSKSSFSLDVDMADSPQTVAATNVPQQNSAATSMWACSLPQELEPNLRCDIIKRNLSEFPDLTDPKWFPERVKIASSPPAQRPSPRVTFPTTPPTQKPPALNMNLTQESHGFRHEKSESFSQTSPVFRNEARYGPPRLKGLAVRFPKESHSSPRLRRPPSASLPLSPHPKFNQREGYSSSRRDKLVEKLEPPAKQKPAPRLTPTPHKQGRVSEALLPAHNKTLLPINLPFKKVKTKLPVAVRAEDAALGLAELMCGIKNAGTDLREAVDDNERQGLINIRGYLRHEIPKRQLAVRAQESMMNEVEASSLIELQQEVEIVAVKRQNESSKDERQHLPERRGYLEHQLSKREL